MGMKVNRANSRYVSLTSIKTEVICHQNFHRLIYLHCYLMEKNAAE